MWRAGLCLILCGCYGQGTPGPSPRDVLAGPDCPPEHLAIAARATAYDAHPMIVRFDTSLSSCRGVVLTDVSESLRVVAGVPDGSELLGFDGRVMRIHGGDVVWDHADAGVVLDAFAMELSGAPYAIVVWGSAAGSGGDRLEVRDLDTGEPVKSYDISYSTVGGAPSGSGMDGVALLDEYDGFDEVRVDLSAEALGGADGLEVLAPRGLGSANAIAAAPGRVAVAGREGVLWWTPDTSAMLGPASCRWPRFEGDTFPEGCEYAGVTFDSAGGGEWLTLCGGALVSLDARDGCALLLPADALPDHALVDLTSP